MNFDFDDLIILDIANNHNGSLEHAKKIVDEMPNTFCDNTAIKLQLRNLDTFIHPDYVDSKQAKRFLDTRMADDDFKLLAQYIHSSDFLLSCTPFDEDSVDTSLSLGCNILKIASCSANDWALIECAGESGLPMVFSTGGLTIHEVDNIVSFCEHKAIDFALHHCVSIYPTQVNQMNLSRITEFKERYPGITIGWSTHENPDRTDIIKSAYGYGARMFERHVASGERNAYSSDGEQVMAWLNSLVEAKRMHESTPVADTVEQSNLAPLKRGLYRRKNNSLFRAIPNNLEGVIDETPEMDRAFILKQDIHEIKAILSYAKVALPVEWVTEFSHHYGPELFRTTGATIIETINRHYAKKLIIMLPGQSHPMHYHKIKDEAFITLWGDLEVTIDGDTYQLAPGESAVVPPGTWHSFSSQNGAIFEEVSTTSIAGDSVYKDPDINLLTNDERKTRVDRWGRFQLQELLS